MKELNEKIKVYASYDTANETWDIFDDDRNCLAYGSVDDIEVWLDENKDTHEESQSESPEENKDEN